VLGEGQLTMRTVFISCLVTLVIGLGYFITIGGLGR
jgi:hypothetical protein